MTGRREVRVKSLITNGLMESVMVAVGPHKWRLVSRSMGSMPLRVSKDARQIIADLWVSR